MKILKIGNKDYILKLNINGMISFEDMTGKPITALNEDVSMGELRSLFHVCLIGGGQYKGDINQTGELMSDYADEHGFDELGAVLGEVATASMGKSKSKAHLTEVTK